MQLSMRMYTQPVSAHRILITSPYVVQVEDIAAKILEWSETPVVSRPASGHLVTVLTQNNKNAWEDVGNPFL